MANCVHLSVSKGCNALYVSHTNKAKKVVDNNDSQQPTMPKSRNKVVPHATQRKNRSILCIPCHDTWRLDVTGEAYLPTKD
eukprot:scaffold154633_cov23-Prasinocladus_malaysianus.AAC.1